MRGTSVVPGSRVFAIVDGQAYWVPYGWMVGRLDDPGDVYDQVELHKGWNQTLRSEADRAKLLDQARLSTIGAERVRALIREGRDAQ